MSRIRRDVPSVTTWFACFLYRIKLQLLQVVTINLFVRLVDFDGNQSDSTEWGNEFGKEDLYFNVRKHIISQSDFHMF